MKNLKVFASQAEALGTKQETPFVGIIDGMNGKAMYAGKSLGKRVTIIEDDYKTAGDKLFIQAEKALTFEMGFASTANSGQFLYTEDGVQKSVNVISTSSLSYINSFKTVTKLSISNISGLQFATVNIADDLEEIDFGYVQASTLSFLSLPKLKSMYNCFNFGKLYSVSLPALPNVTTMERCLYSCSNLARLNFPSAPKLENMSRCFVYCSSLNVISLPALPEVTNMGECFSYCSNLYAFTAISLPKVENLFRCFDGCKNIMRINLPALSNVMNMRECFRYCSSLTSISLSELPNVTTMEGCFWSCTSLTSISLPALPNVTNMSWCFYCCTSLTSISIPELPKVTNMSWCFNYCYSLTCISLPELPNVTNMYGCFSACSLLQNLTISVLPDYDCLSNWCLGYCTALTIESLVNVLNALPTTSGGYTCTLGATNLNKLTADQKAIATGKGWTLN